MLVLSLFILLAAVALPSIQATPALLTRTTSLALLFSAVLSYNALESLSLGSGISVYNALLHVTPVALFADTLILVAGAIAIIPWAPISTTRIGGIITVPTLGNYPLFVLFSTCGATLLTSSSDLITLYLAIELQSFAVYILAALYRDEEGATSAGLLYFLLGGLSSSLILLGSSLIYASLGQTNLEAIIAVLSVIDMETNIGLPLVGFTILAVGLLFKITAAPFHNWGPDVYDRVPTIVTTWLAIMPKISILALLLELQGGLGSHTLAILGLNNYDTWTSLLLASSLLSLLVGTIVGLAQTRIKRLLAYSTVSHVGFLLLALSVYSSEAVEAYLFYLMQYTFTALTSFMTLLALGYAIRTNMPQQHTTDIGSISDLTGVFRTHPLLGFSMAVCLFSIAGVPPLVGFFAKQAVLYTAMHAGYVFMSLIAVVTSVISASYYLRVVRVVHFDDIINSSSSLSVETPVMITSVHSYLISVGTLSLLGFIAASDLVLDSIRLIALTMYTT